MSTLATLFNHYWLTLLGFGSVITLIVAGIIFVMGWPVVSAVLKPLMESLGNWLEYNLSLELDGWKTISQSVSAFIFLITAMFGMHVVDKYYWLQQDTSKVCALMLQDLREQYKFVERPKPKSKWHL